MIQIKEFAYISEKGRRSNNEDNVGFVDSTVFVVCDGVGGLDKGEIASEIVCKSLLHSFEEKPLLDIKDALSHAEFQLSNYAQQYENSKGMATTLTLAQVRQNGVYLAWCGDSRIYHFRAGKIKYVTRDHSWVNDALASGIITLEESINHPKSNIITRAVQGQHKPEIADFKMITDVLEGDFFLLCSDGILESWSNEELQSLFEEGKSAPQLLEIIKEKCEQFSKDNFTAIVMKVGDVSMAETEEETEEKWVEAIPYDITHAPEQPKSKWSFNFLKFLKKSI